MRELLQKVLGEVEPTEKERENVSELCEEIEKRAEETGEECETMYCGSIAKDTWLQKQKDLDLFLLFDENISGDELEEKGKELGKKIIEEMGGEWDIAYAEHPYVHGRVKGYEVDIVPAYDVEPGEVKSSVDRTPWHVRWVEDNLDKQQKNEVRLLKKFTKEHGIYGSDLKTRGFSGYLCEILIAEHGSFENLFEETKNWQAGEVIDVENHHDSDDFLRNEKFENAVFVAVDPIDGDRNVASVLSPEKFFLFKKKAKEFLDEPSQENFFHGEVEPLSTDDIKGKFDERGTNPLLIRFDAPDVHRDVLFPQMRKMNRRIGDMLADEGFVVLRKDVWSDQEACVLILELEVDEVSKIDKRRGPSIFDRRNSERFIERYGEEDNLLVEDDRWYAEYWRDATTAVEFVKMFFRDGERDLPEKGVPRHLAEKIEEYVEVASDSDTYKIFEEFEDLRRRMRDYFEKDLA